MATVENLVTKQLIVPTRKAIKTRARNRKISKRKNSGVKGTPKAKARVHCTNDDENNNEMEEIEVIDLCSVSRCRNDAISEGKESAMQEGQDKSKHDETDKKINDLKTVRDEPTIKDNKVKSAMMCRKSTENLTEEEPRGKPKKVANKLIETTEKQKHEEEHVEPTVYTGN